MTNGATTDRSHITMTPVPELRYNYKEADSCLLLHASHAAHRGSTTVVLRSPDSDVAIIAIGIGHTIPATMLFNTGTLQRKETSISLKLDLPSDQAYVKP